MKKLLTALVAAGAIAVPGVMIGSPAGAQTQSEVPNEAAFRVSDDGFRQAESDAFRGAGDGYRQAESDAFRGAGDGFRQGESDAFRGSGDGFRQGESDAF